MSHNPNKRCLEINENVERKELGTALTMAIVLDGSRPWTCERGKRVRSHDVNLVVEDGESGVFYDANKKAVAWAFSEFQFSATSVLRPLPQPRAKLLPIHFTARMLFCPLSFIDLSLRHGGCSIQFSLTYFVDLLRKD